MTTGHVAHVRKLYKLILRLHRNLPAELRFLGDSYAKEEFRRHKKCKPEEARIFLNEWQDYASTMFRQVSPTPAQRQDPEGNEPRIADEANQVTTGSRVPRPPAPTNEEGFILRPTPRYGNRLPEEVYVALSRGQMYHLHELQAVAAGGNNGLVIPGGAIEAANIQEPSAQAPNAQAFNLQASIAQASNDPAPNTQASNAQACNDQASNDQARAHVDGYNAEPNAESGSKR